jgi:hypothetical protein
VAIQDFVKLASVTLGATEQTVRVATAAVLDVIAHTAPTAEVQQLFERIPGARELLHAVRPAPPAPSPPPPSGVAAALGDLVTSAATVVQGTLGGGAALVRLVTEVGFDPQKALAFATLFVTFLKAQAGPDLVDRVLGFIPGASLFRSQK